MLTDEQRIKVYGSAERVAEVDAQIQANVDAMPPLTARQRDALKILLGTRTMPPRPQKRRTAPSVKDAAAANR
jgi:hypothetical protein